MAWRGTIHEKDKFVEITASDSVSVNDMIESRRFVEASWRSHGIKATLVDVRKVREIPVIIEIFAFGASFSDTVIPPGVKFSILTSKVAEKGMRFLETVAQNRGILVQVFTSETSALDWLK